MLKEREMKKIIMSFENGEVTEDVLNGRQTLCRLSVEIPISDNISEIIKMLKSISIRPEKLYIEKNICSIDWWTQKNLVILDKKNYLRLLDEFLSYIETLGFDKYRFQSGCLQDILPNLDYDVYVNSNVVINPKFTKDNFDYTGEIEISELECTEDMLKKYQPEVYKYIIENIGESYFKNKYIFD